MNDPTADPVSILSTQQWERDCSRMREMALDLERIIARREKRGIKVSGLENAKREIEWASRGATCPK